MNGALSCPSATASRSEAATLPAYMAGKRDLRIDLLRGAAIVAMIVDHVGGDQSWLYPLTGGNRFYVSAAEAFLFLSGVVTGIVYGAVAARQGLGAAIVKMLRRAAVLYAWTVGLTLTLPILAHFLGLDWDDPFHDKPALDYVVSVITLHHTYFLADILLVYVLLFSFAGLALALISEGKTTVVLGLSWGAWLAWQLWPQYANLPWSIEGMDVFNIGPWQALFFTGLVLGVHRKAAGKLLARAPRYVYLLAGAFGLAIAIVLYTHELQVFLLTAPNVNAQSLADRLFSKADLRIGRLVVFACAAAFAFSLTTLMWRRVEALLGWLLLPLGQHSLTAYALHLGIVAALSKLGDIAFGEDGRGAPQNTLLQLTGVVAIWLAIQSIIAIQHRWAARDHVLDEPILGTYLPVRISQPVAVPVENRQSKGVPHAA